MECTMFRIFVNGSLCCFCLSAFKLETFGVSHGNCLKARHFILLELKVRVKVVRVPLLVSCCTCFRFGVQNVCNQFSCSRGSGARRTS